VYANLNFLAIPARGNDMHIRDDGKALAWGKFIDLSREHAYVFKAAYCGYLTTYGGVPFTPPRTFDTIAPGKSFAIHVGPHRLNVNKKLRECTGMATADVFFASLLEDHNTMKMLEVF
jgi:hypothetical protein